MTVESVTVHAVPGKLCVWALAVSSCAHVLSWRRGRRGCCLREGRLEGQRADSVWVGGRVFRRSRRVRTHTRPRCWWLSHCRGCAGGRGCALCAPVIDFIKPASCHQIPTHQVAPASAEIMSLGLGVLVCKHYP